MYHFLRHAVRLLPALAVATVLTAGTDKSGYTFFNPTPAGELRELSTDRPDQTESAYTVDAGHWQVESDLLNHTRDHDRTGGGEVRTTDLSLAAFNLKVGLTNRVDLQLMIDPYVSSRVEDRIAGTTAKASGFGDITTRLKINLWGNDGGPTAFAVMPYVKWPSSASGVRNDQTEGGVILMLAYELPDGWSSTIMTGLDFVSDGAGGRDTEWINCITFAHALTDKLGGYIELFTVMGDAPGFKSQCQFDVGLTYTVSADIQLDLGCNFGVTKSAPDYQPFVGFSRRF